MPSKANIILPILKYIAIYESNSTTLKWAFLPLLLCLAKLQTYKDHEYKNILLITLIHYLRNSFVPIHSAKKRETEDSPYTLISKLSQGGEDEKTGKAVWLKIMSPLNLCQKLKRLEIVFMLKLYQTKIFELNTSILTSYLGFIWENFP